MLELELSGEWSAYVIWKVDGPQLFNKVNYEVVISITTLRPSKLGELR